MCHGLTRTSPTALSLYVLIPSFCYFIYSPFSLFTGVRFLKTPVDSKSMGIEPLIHLDQGAWEKGSLPTSRR